MICLNCKKQIPDDSTKCPFCGHEVNYERQIVHEVRFRRYQRWALYGVIILVFAGMAGAIIKIYSANTKLILQIANVNGDLDKASKELEGARSDLNDKNSRLSEANANLIKAQEELDGKTSDFKKRINDLENRLAEDEKRMGEFEAVRASLSASNANIYTIIAKQGEGLKEADFYKLPIADDNIASGHDSDSDGLSDEFEVAIGTDPNLIDSDGDGYDDKAEALGGFNPRGTGKQAIDLGFVNRMKGKIVLQVEKNGEAWYVGFDAKRHFLGKPLEAASNMEVIQSQAISPVQDLSSNN